MSVKPILFSTEMVQAILDGKKTVTRRVIKPQPDEELSKWIARQDKRLLGSASCPFGTYGDILYVRETWNLNNLREDGNTFELGFIYKAFKDSFEDSFRWVKVSEAIYDKYADSMAESNFDGWRPSIHMPKEAARIWLKVTDVRAERLQDIDADGIRNEGLASLCVHVGGMEITQKEFALLWDSTIKKKDLSLYGWDANPWVWVIEFERCEKPEEA